MENKSRSVKYNKMTNESRTWLYISNGLLVNCLQVGVGEKETLDL